MASGDMALRNMLISYKHNHEAMNDIRSAVQNFKDLRHQMKVFTYGNGQTKNLVCLEGTIPISYKTKTYNIPVIIWFHETHPFNAPMVFVQPTATMSIKPGPHVGQNGAVTIPYLNDWRQGASDTTTLISVLCMVFGESPPVFANGRNPPPSQPHQPPPYPVSGSNMPTPYPPSGQTSYPPAPPVYPAQPNSAYPTNTNNATPQGYNPYGTSSQTPYPPTTAATIGGHPTYGQGTGYHSYPSANSTGYPPQPTSGYPAVPTPVSYPSPTPYSNYPSTTYANPAASAATPTVPSALQRQKSSGLSEEENKQVLLMTVQDMMSKKLKEIFEAHENEMSALRNTQKELAEGKENLEKMSGTIQTETSECEATAVILSAKISELKAEIEKNQSDDELPAEDAIETTAPIYKQLMQSFAEEQAIEDTLYILGDGLRRETIGIELYLKKVRDLSRKQFMLRALIQKCREQAGLSDVYS